MLTIRPETPADYPQITELHIRAFNNQTDEATIVALLRQRQAYTPELSLVAEQEGRIVGHALFTPTIINLMGKQVYAVLLAPLGVLPEFQGQGIGAELMHAGHSAAQKHDIHLGMLLGHDTYYPRFGYRIDAFGDSKLSAYVERSEVSLKLTTRAPLPSDIPALMALWEHEEGAVDFAMHPEPRLADWLSLYQSRGSQVYVQDDTVVGYVRGLPNSLKVFMAQNGDVARAMVADLGDDQSINLPLHPLSKSAAAFDTDAEATAWSAGMAIGLSDEGTALLNRYFAAVAAGERPAGRPIWNTAFG